MRENERRCSWPRTLVATLAGLAGVLGVNFAAVVVVGLVDLPMETVNPQREWLGTGWKAILLAGILVPILEELLFRRLWFGALRRRYGFWEASLLPSLAFGLIHGAVAFGAVFLSGMVLCWLYERTGRILAPMLVHVANNILVLALPASEAMAKGSGAILAAAAAILMAILAVYTIYQITEEFYCQND